jgi:hypothetical protein
VSSNHLSAEIPAFRDSAVEVPFPISYSAGGIEAVSATGQGISMRVAETHDYVSQRPKRAAAIRRDGDDFVVSLMPNDLVIFRNESVDALRKLCNGLRWAIVSDTAIASI